MRHEFLQHSVDLPKKKIEQVSLGSLETARGLWLSSSELDEKAAAGRKR